MVVILTTVPTAKQYVLKMFYYFLEYHGTTERSGADPRLLPRCLRFSHTSLLRRKVANKILAANAHELIEEEALSLFGGDEHLPNRGNYLHAAAHQRTDSRVA